MIVAHEKTLEITRKSRAQRVGKGRGWVQRLQSTRPRGRDTVSLLRLQVFQCNLLPGITRARRLRHGLAG